MKKNCPKRLFLHVEETESTNNDIKKMIYSGDCRAVVLSADTQSNGRGRLGRSFLSPRGGVYFSAAYPLSGGEDNIPFLTLAAGLAVAESIENSPKADGAPAPLIKWPNDIYLNGKKVCGILTELVRAGEKTVAVVGVGVNLKSFGEKLPKELENKISTLNCEGYFPESGDFIRLAVARLDRLVYVRGVLGDVPDDIVEELNRRSFVRGREIVFFDGQNETCGTALSIERDGSLRAATENGDFFIRFGEITTPKNGGI